jgi:hypothetical protein
VFGLSIRTTEPELHKVFDDIAPVEKVVIVYDARVRIVDSSSFRFGADPLACSRSARAASASSR